MGEVIRIVIGLACLAFLAVLVLNAYVPRRINPRNGLYVREWWRFSNGGSRGGGHDYTGPLG